MLAYNFFRLWPFRRSFSNNGGDANGTSLEKKILHSGDYFAAQFVMAAFGQPSIEMLDTLLKLKLRMTD